MEACLLYSTVWLLGLRKAVLQCSPNTVLHHSTAFLNPKSQAVLWRLASCIVQSDFKGIEKQCCNSVITHSCNAAVLCYLLSSRTNIKHVNMCHSSNAELQNDLIINRHPSLTIGWLSIWLWFLCRVILAEWCVILQMQNCRINYPHTETPALY